MGRKNNLKSFAIINAQSMASNITSSVTDIQWLDDIGIQFVWSGSPTGNFQILVSADYNNQSPTTPTGNFVPLTVTYYNGTTFITSNMIPTSLGSPIYVDLALLSAPFIQVSYTGSGTGTLTATITAKMIG